MVTLKIEQNADTKDLYIEIPHYIRQELNWTEGDTLIWEVQSDNTISVRKERSVSQYKKDIIQEYIKETFGQVYYSPEAQGSWVKHTRCSNMDLFPVNCMPWRLEPRTNKFNLSWYMCFDHAVDQIERSNLKPRDYKLMCYTSVPLSDPLTGPVRIQRYVRS